MQTEKLICKICGNEQSDNLYVVKEMMFGFRDEFEYFQCNRCACLQIKEIPQDLSKYYPKEYYSFRALPGAEGSNHDNFIHRYFRKKRTLFFMYKKSLLGRLIFTWKPITEPFSGYLVWLKNCQAHLTSKILDVGCGKGNLLNNLSWFGFSDLTGLDPNIENEIIYGSGVRILKKELSSLQDKYDVLMFHHSFEHMSCPQEVFKCISRLLNDRGRVLIRTPIVPSYAWKHYGVNWVQVDAPRHFFIHSLKSIEILAAQADLKVKEVIYDSSEFQFLGSQQYERGIPLLSDSSYYVNPKASVFNTEQIDFFRSEAVRFNTERQGDQICVYLAKQ